jgi:integrase/recombinase XerD
MKEGYDSFERLKNELLEKLRTRGCSSTTITGYRYLCNSIISWLMDNGYVLYTKEGGNTFLQEYLSKHGNNQYYTNLRTVVYRLNDLVDDKWEDVHSDKGKHFILSDEFIDIVNKYCSDETAKGLASGTIKYKRYAISWFFHELVMLQCFSLTQLSPKAIVQACTKITDHNLWGEVRLFLRYLLLEEKLEKDYSTLVPHYSKPYVIPSVYSIDEIKRIENSVDTSTIQGKRDYANILLASRMGLRSGDIVRLKIDDIKGAKEINIIQQKTGKALHLPLIEEVSVAIEDYLSVRPPSMAKEIFINIYAPYNPISTGTIRNLLKKYIAAAGVDVGNRRKGPHALRSSLASSMVNDDVSYETVRKVLGHSSNNAIKHYARIDVEKLRQYCLEPPQISGRFEAFLKGEVI